MTRLIDLAGQRFGRLVVAELAPKLDRRTRWICQCDCGNVSHAQSDDLRSGHSKSCGCLSKEMARDRHTSHGATAGGKPTRSYKAWQGMHRRCSAIDGPDYPYYQGRGITVCDRWASYEAFVTDMGAPPPGHSLERKDNALGYGPDNCVWATPLEQSRNRRNVHRIVICGRDMTIAEACDVHGVKLRTVNFVPMKSSNRMPRHFMICSANKSILSSD